MAQKIKRGLGKLKEYLFEYDIRNLLKKRTPGYDAEKKSPYVPMDREDRRKAAMDYWIRKAHESKRLMEERRKKMESYGRLRWWAYRRTENLKDAGMMFKESVGKPVFWACVAWAGWSYFSILPDITTFIIKNVDKAVPYPYNIPVNLVLCFPTGFSVIITPNLAYYLVAKRQIKKRLREDYGLDI